MIGLAESVGYEIDYNKLIKNTPYSNSIEAFLYLENIMIEKDININYDKILINIDVHDDDEINKEFDKLVSRRILKRLDPFSYR